MSLLRSGRVAWIDARLASAVPSGGAGAAAAALAVAGMLVLGLMAAPATAGLQVNRRPQRPTVRRLRCGSGQSSVVAPAPRGRVTVVFCPADCCQSVPPAALAAASYIDPHQERGWQNANFTPRLRT